MLFNTAEFWIMEREPEIVREEIAVLNIVPGFVYK
jgi:hypothetical protein